MSAVLEKLLSPIIPEFIEAFKKQYPRIISGFLDIAAALSRKPITEEFYLKRTLSESIPDFIRAVKEIARKMPDLKETPTSKQESLPEEVQAALCELIRSVTTKHSQDTMPEEECENPSISFMATSIHGNVPVPFEQERAPFQESSLVEFLALMACKGPFELIPPKEMYETQSLFGHEEIYQELGQYSTEGCWTILFHLQEKHES